MVLILITLIRGEIQCCEVQGLFLSNAKVNIYNVTLDKNDKKTKYQSKMVNHNNTQNRGASCHAEMQKKKNSFVGDRQMWGYLWVCTQYAHGNADSQKWKTPTEHLSKSDYRRGFLCPVGVNCILQLTNLFSWAIINTVCWSTPVCVHVCVGELLKGNTFSRSKTCPEGWCETGAEGNAMLGDCKCDRFCFDINICLLSNVCFSHLKFIWWHKNIKMLFLRPISHKKFLNLPLR